MSVLEQQAPKTTFPLEPDLNLLPLEPPYEDGEPLESNWHRAEIGLLAELLDQLRPDHRNYFAGGNMFIYYSLQQVRNRDYKGPDFFVVLDVDGTVDRNSWIVWEEAGRFPNVIVELLSPSTASYDKNAKKTLYEQTFRTPEYFCYDPATEELLGWRLINGTYEPIPPNENDGLWCAQLNLWLGHWEGDYLGIHATWLRYFTTEDLLVATHKERAEAQAIDIERQIAVERERATISQHRAEAEQHRAEAEQHRAEAEQHRAEALAQELAALRNRLRRAGIDPDVD